MPQPGDMILWIDSGQSPAALRGPAVVLRAATGSESESPGVFVTLALGVTFSAAPAPPPGGGGGVALVHDADVVGVFNAAATNEPAISGLLAEG